MTTRVAVLSGPRAGDVVEVERMQDLLPLVVVSVSLDYGRDVNGRRIVSPIAVTPATALDFLAAPASEKSEQLRMRARQVFDADAGRQAFKRRKG